MNRAELHEAEMHIVRLYDEGTLTREEIINTFTDLMGRL